MDQYYWEIKKKAVSNNCIKIVEHVMIIFLIEQVVNIATVKPLKFAFIKEIKLFFLVYC